MLSIRKVCKLTASSATIRHNDWHNVDSKDFPKMPSYKMTMGSRILRMVPDGLPKIPKPSRSAEVSKSVKEGHGRVSEHREDMPKHTDSGNSAFGNPLGS